MLHILLCFFIQFSKYNLAALSQLVGSNGLEPSTSRLSGVRSNHLSYEPISVAGSFPIGQTFWWRRTESNCRPPACKAGALPAELHPHIRFAVSVGLSFAPPSFQGSPLKRTLKIKQCSLESLSLSFRDFSLLTLDVSPNSRLGQVSIERR